MPVINASQRPIVIGLCGLAGSGKSTVAHILSEDWGFARKPFAYPLKAMLGALGIPRDVLDGDNTAKESPLDILGGKSARHAMQTLGTEWGRQHIGQDFWVELWKRNALTLPKIVADDCRFPNEVEAIRAMGGMVVRIERPGAGSKTGAGHASESIGSLEHDLTLFNTRSIEELREFVARIVREYAEAA